MNPPPGQPPIDPRGVLRPPGTPPVHPMHQAPHPMPGAPAPGGGPMPPYMGRPPMPPMMPMMPPPGWLPFAPPRSGGGGRGVVVGLLVALLGLSLLFNLILLLIVAVSSGPEPGQSVQRVIADGEIGQTVAVIPVFGIIFDDVEHQFQDDLETAEQDENVKAIVVHIDSPGGTVTDSHQMYEALRQFAERSGKPVVVHMDSVAASGGYFLACAADEIVAEESTITGSIGVLVSYPQLSGFAEKTGIRFETIVAEGSPHKNALDTWREPTEEERQQVLALLNDQHDLFRRVVEAGRGPKLASQGSKLEDVANGMIWLGPQAQKLGLVDRIGFIETATDRAATRAGLTNHRVVRYTREPTLAELFGLANAGSAGGGAGGAGGTGGLSLDLRSLESPELKRAAGRLIHELSTPHSLYLYRGVQ